MKYHTVYKITNLFNEKIYVGYHSTDNLHDGYMGSGLRIKRLIKKYGVHSFVKEILHTFDTEEEMIAKEIELVTQEFILRDSNYNLVPGGGSFDSKSSKVAAERLKEKLATDPEFADKWSETSRKNMLGRMASSDTRRKMSINNTGKKLSEEHKAKTRQTVSRLLFINKGNKNKRIRPELLESYLSDGWVTGRYMSKEQISYLPNALGKIWFHNTSGETILRYKNDTASLLSLGWKLGRKPSTK